MSERSPEPPIAALQDAIAETRDVLKRYRPGYRGLDFAMLRNQLLIMEALVYLRTGHIEDVS